MQTKLWTKYKKIKEIQTNNSNLKAYLARIELIIKEIIPKNKYEYYIIRQRLEKIKEEGELNIYEIIEEDEKIYIVIDNNEEILSKIDKLILSSELYIEKQGMIKGHGRPISKEEIFDLFKMEKSMCKITYETYKGEIGQGSGFFCKIDNFSIKYALFTNNHILNESNIEIGKIISFECLELKKSIFSSSYIKIKKEIKITEERRVFTNKNLDYTCIELFESDGIIDYFKIEPKLFKNDKKFLKDNDIFILQYFIGSDLSLSVGKILFLKDSRILHNASTGKGSSGSSIIIRSKNNYIIGLHFGGVKMNNNKYKYNLGISFDSILDNIIEQTYNINSFGSIFNNILEQKNNIINCIYIPNKDKNETRLLHDYNKDIKIWDKKDKKAYLEAKKDISEENIEIYVNDNIIKFDYKYNIENSKEIKVKFKFKKLLTNINYMFYECTSLKSIDLSSFNITNVNDMNNMFCRCSSLESIDLSSFNTANVNNMNNMFNECFFLKSIDLSSFNTTNVNDMSYMFCKCSSLKSIDLSSFNTTNVNDMSYMFCRCSSLKSINLSSFNTTNVNNMNSIFYGCSSLESIDLSSFNTTNVYNMGNMLYGCSSLKIIDLSSFNIANVNIIYGMFAECPSLISIDLSSFNTTNIATMSGMFSGCSSLRSIDLSSFNTTNVNNMSNIFFGCFSLKKENIKIKNKNDKLLNEFEKDLKYL